MNGHLVCEAPPMAKGDELKKTFEIAGFEPGRHFTRLFDYRRRGPSLSLRRFLRSEPVAG
jgi:hypothetical protein